MLILNRSRQRAPNLRIRDRLIAGLCSLCKVAPAFKTSTLRSFHRARVQRKYRLFVTEAANKTRTQRPGRRSDPWRRRDETAQFDVGMPPDRRSESTLAFGTSINKDMVCRILAVHYQPAPNADG